MKEKLNYIVAVLLMFVVFVVGGMTVFKNYRSLVYATMVTYTQYLKDDIDAFSNIKARIASLESNINVNILGKRFFELFNARFQLALGKEMLSFGGTTMVSLKTGQLYDVQKDTDVRKDVATISRLNEKLTEQGIPLVYVYAHSELYEEEGLLPDAIRDFNNKVADDIVRGLRSAGIKTIDSRDIYKEKGMTLEDVALRTDQHWTPLMAFEAYSESVKVLNSTRAITLDESAADSTNFNIKLLKNIHMGDVGARVGERVIEPDDFALITPVFGTNITRVSSGDGKRSATETGAFADVVLNMAEIEGDQAHNVYDLYGSHNELTYYTNENVPDGRLLIIKDSFGTPVASFMSLATHEVCALDLRKSRHTIEQMVEEFRPQAVLIVHCQEMMRGKNYVFVG